ncbi:phage tail protein [Vibrio vulnificus]
MANTTDKSILTAAGKALLAQLNAEEKPLIIDKMIFANVPNRPEYPQPDDVVPTDHVVHQEGVEQRGRLTADSVIYSTTLTSDVGPFEFNWTGAYCSEHGVLVTIDHHALTPKTADEPGVAGNTLVRSVVLEYKDIAEITNITVDASSWQYNATPRMKKMDEDVAQAIIDQNGKDWFIDDGFLVTPSGSAYNIKAGGGYVSGNRVAMEFDRSVQVQNKPSFIYIDAHREGTPTGEQVTLFDFVITAEEKDDYTDANEVKHFVCKIAQVLADGSVGDLRPMGESASIGYVDENIVNTTNRIMSGKVHIGKGSAKVNDVVEAITHLCVDEIIYQCDPAPVSGKITVLDLVLNKAVIGGANVELTPIPKEFGFANVEQFKSVDDFSEYMKSKRIMLNTKTPLSSVNPWKYGAKGGGEDDTIPIMKMLERGGEIRIEDDFCFNGILRPVSHSEICGSGKLSVLDGVSKIWIEAVTDVKLRGFEMDGRKGYLDPSTAPTSDRAIIVTDRAENIYMEYLRIHDYYFTGVYVGGGPGITPPKNIHHNGVHVYDIGSADDILHQNRGNGFVCSAGQRIFYDMCEAKRIHGVGGFNAEGGHLLREDLIYTSCIADTITHTDVMPPSAHGFRFNDPDPVAQGNKNLHYINCISRNVAGDNFFASDVSEVLLDTCRAYKAGRNNYHINQTKAASKGDITLDGCHGDVFGYKGLAISGGRDISVIGHKELNGSSGSLEAYQVVRDANTRTVSLCDLTAANVQTHVLSISAHNYRIDGLNIVDMGMAGGGVDYYAITTPAGVTDLPVCNRGIIDDINVSSESAGANIAAGIYAEGDRFSNTVLGKMQLPNGVPKVRYGNSDKYNIVNGPYPVKPDEANAVVGSASYWHKGDTIKLDGAVNAGDPTEAECVESGVPGVWKNKNPLM